MAGWGILQRPDESLMRGMSQRPIAPVHAANRYRAGTVRPIVLRDRWALGECRLRFVF